MTQEGTPGASGAPTPESAAAIKAYELSRARYLNTIKSDVEKKLLDSVGKRRDALTTEINNLTALAKTRHAARAEALRVYSAKCPGRVTAAGLLPPGAGNAFSGADKLYKTAVKAAEEFNEVNDIIRKRREALAELDADLRKKAHEYNEELVKQLETPEGLANAFRRDPLLQQAHARMESAVSGRGPAVTSAGAPE